MNREYIYSCINCGFPQQRASPGDHPSYGAEPLSLLQFLAPVFKTRHSTGLNKRLFGTLEGRQLLFVMVQGAFEQMPGIQLLCWMLFVFLFSSDFLYSDFLSR